MGAMNPLFWTVAHIAGMLLLFAALGGAAALAAAGAPAPAGQLYRALHGVALVVLLVAGFGALARLGLSSPGAWPAWVWAKLLIWLLFGAALTLVSRAAKRAGIVLVGLVLLGALAAWFALARPSF